METRQRERAGCYSKMDARIEEMQKIYVGRNTQARMNLSQVQSRHEEPLRSRRLVLLHVNEGLGVAD
ncbi:MAG: hypothetical protein ACLUUO_14480 [Sellimonas intestinalis]